MKTLQRIYDYDENTLFLNAFLQSTIGKIIISSAGKFLKVNPSFCKFIGYSMEELLKIDFQSVTYPEDIEPDVTNVKRMFNGEIPSFEMEKRFIHKDGSVIWGLLNCSLVRDEKESPLFAVTEIIDITSRKKAEEELIATLDKLKKSNSVFEIIANHSKDIITIADPNRITKFISPTVTKLLGYEKEEVLNKPITDFCHPDDLEKVAQSFDLETSNEGTFDSRVHHKNGQYISFETTVKAVRNSDGVIEHIVGIGRDMTERNQAMHYMILSEKLSVISQLAAGIAHEIRNPLTAIKGFTNLLNDKFDDESFYFDIIIDEITRIEQIINELLFLSKPKKMDWKKKSIHTVLEQVIALLRPQANLHNIILTEKIENKEVMVWCDENSLKQVFINVIKNSIEAMSSGGKIQIETIVKNKQIIIKFVDQGCGIPKEILNKIGTPFYTTKENGTGLGVMICHKIIEDHKGCIKIWSDVNVGTTFTITLPTI